VELEHVYRQTDPTFVSLLNRLRVAEDTDAVVEQINNRCYHADDTEHELTLACTNKAADGLNEAAMASLDTTEYLLQGTIEGTFSRDRERLPSPMDLRLKVGAQVMFTKNDEQQRWVNGSLGLVRGMAGDSVQVQMTGDGERTVHDVLPVSWETYEYGLDPTEDRIVAQKVGEYRQYPLMPAWAVTIHKSQGKTLGQVLIDFGWGAFAPGQAYVALSRCRTLDGIRLARPLRSADVKCDPRIRRFYEERAGSRA
jgi:ATP-dependent DNA helicase PIF1